MELSYYLILNQSKCFLLCCNSDLKRISLASR